MIRTAFAAPIVATLAMRVLATSSAIAAPGPGPEPDERSPAREGSDRDSSAGHADAASEPAAAPAPRRATDPPMADPVLVEPIVITATRTARPLFDVPSSRTS